MNRNVSEQAWTKVFLQNKNLTELDRKAVVELIEEIVVYEDKKIDVRFRYTADFERAMHAVRMMPVKPREAAV